MLKSGRIQWPETLTVCYADTRMELPPLSIAAYGIIDRLRELGIDVRVVMAPLDKRYFVYMLGRGVPPPKNTFRWCTGQIKVEPMKRELERIAVERMTARWVIDKNGKERCVPFPGEKILMLTGVRQGESAMRDGRIAMSCGRDGAECGQGWYQESLPDDLCDTLAPILHWRVCHVWAWLRHWAPKPEYGEWDTEDLADAYGGDEAEEINARTGCLGCPLASRDTALDAVMKSSRWEYLEPFKELRPLYQELWGKEHRKRMPKGEQRKDGTLTKVQCRQGPLTMQARQMALERILDIQARINAAAVCSNRPTVDILNSEEEARIRELILANTWPRRWTGLEDNGDEYFVEDKGPQKALFAALEGVE
jgi:DNA sulfur modification protein DndC